MNDFQKLWWQQAQSDHDVLVLLRQRGAKPCHQLHYLQMVTEKPGKAFFWREGKPRGMSHAIFVEFLRDFSRIRESKERQKIADVFGFPRFDDLKDWIRAIMPPDDLIVRLQEEAWTTPIWRKSMDKKFPDRITRTLRLCGGDEKWMTHTGTYSDSSGSPPR